MIAAMQGRPGAGIYEQVLVRSLMHVYKCISAALPKKKTDITAGTVEFRLAASEQHALDERMPQEKERSGAEMSIGKK